MLKGLSDADRYRDSRDSWRARAHAAEDRLSELERMTHPQFADIVGQWRERAETPETRNLDGMMQRHVTPHPK